jgi:hypothetical protein
MEAPPFSLKFKLRCRSLFQQTRNGTLQVKIIHEARRDRCGASVKQKQELEAHRTSDRSAARDRPRVTGLRRRSARRVDAFGIALIVDRSSSGYS